MSTCGCHTPTEQPAATAFVRPRFFAGQLLTEDDLEALSGYVTAKSRLHNRHLFGAGVVCGLQVTCDPCGGGTVRVAPGYALDCCGNDIVVDCATTLDVNALIRDLRMRSLGADCGDPGGAGTTGGTESAEPGRRPPTTRHYCLYVRFAEETTDPVAPYATDEPCGHQACEPTRIREGHRFLLRCREPEPPIDDLVARLVACLPGYGDRRTDADLGRVALYAPAMTQAAAVGDAPVEFTVETDLKRLVTRLDTLKATVADLDKAGTSPAGDQARELADDVRAVAATVTRFDLQDEATRKKLVDEHATELGRLGEARTAVADAAARLQPVVDATWPDRFDREAALATLAQAIQVGGDNTGALGRAEVLMLAQGLPWSTGAQAALRDGAAGLKEWLLDRLDAADGLTDCELRDVVANLPMPSTAEQELTQRGLGDTGAVGDRLIEALRRYFVDCVCAALNPPCLPCADADVLLACVEVRDCDVVRICNTARQFVVSGAAVRYWLPLERLGRLVEQWCCAPPRRPARPAPGSGSGGTSSPVQLAVTAHVFEPAPPRELPEQILGALAALGLRIPGLGRLSEADRMRTLDAQVAGLAERFGITRGQLTAARGLITKLSARVSKLEGDGP